MVDYPIAFLREIDGLKKDEILKGFIDAFFQDRADVEAIQDPELKKNYFELLVEADKACTIMLEKLDSVGLAAAKEIRQKSKGKSVKDRAKDAGLVTVTANIPKPKKLIL